MLVLKHVASSIQKAGNLIGLRETMLGKNVLNKRVLLKDFTALHRGMCRDTLSQHRKALSCFRSFSNTAQEKGEENSVCDEFSEVMEDEILESDFRDITKGDPELENKLKEIILHTSLLRERNQNIPDRLRKKDWESLMVLPSPSQRHKFLKFLFINEKKKEGKIRKKMERRERRLELAEISDNEHLTYGLGNMSMFLRIYEKSLSRVLNNRLLGALMYSQTVVFDCSYSPFMTRINESNCASQLFYSFCTNRKHPAPFHVALCNVDKESYTISKSGNIISGLLDNSTPWDVYEQCYTEVFPREKIVYLSPHARQPLLDYSHDDIYVIGAFVDKGTTTQVSLAKAKEKKVRMAKLPIDHYLSWKKGTKSLPINMVLSILLDRRLHDWKTALQNIPQRCLVE